MKDGDLGEGYSLRSWMVAVFTSFKSTPRAAWAVFLKGILLPTVVFTVLMTSAVYYGAHDLRIPVKSVKLHSVSRYESADLDVRYEQKKSDTKPMLYAREVVDLKAEAFRWFIVALVATASGAAFARRGQAKDGDKNVHH